MIDVEPLEFKLPTIHLEYDSTKCDALIEAHILGAKVTKVPRLAMAPRVDMYEADLIFPPNILGDWL